MQSTWGDWSPWLQDETYRPYRYRRDAHGYVEFDYEFDYDSSSHVPRASQPLDGLVQDFQSIALSPVASHNAGRIDPDYQLPDDIAENAPEKPRSSKSRGKDKDERRYEDKHKGKDRGDSKGKGRSQHRSKHHDHRDEQLLQRTKHATPTMSRQPDGETTWNQMCQSSYAYDQPYDGNFATSPYQHQIAGHSAYEPLDAEMEQMQQGIEASRRTQYVNAAGAGPSAGVSNASSGGAVSEEMFEEMDPRFRVEPSTRFDTGMILKVFWCEPFGNEAKQMPTTLTCNVIKDRYGMKYYVGPRRFVIIANDQGHFSGVPIALYRGQACKKPGVKPAKHGIIHEHDKRARRLDGEPVLGFPPVRAFITVSGERLRKESRIDYARLQTILHNVPVFFIGHVDERDLHIVKEAADECWANKTHRPRRH